MKKKHLRIYNLVKLKLNYFTYYYFRDKLGTIINNNNIFLNYYTIVYVNKMFLSHLSLII